MIGSVQVAVATTVLPFSLSKAFVREEEYKTVSNHYAGGEQQVNTLVSQPRRRWRQGKRLTAPQMDDLQKFYDARKGETEAFYFYDPFGDWENAAPFFHDETGASATGRYKVRFVGSLRTQMLGRFGTADLELLEVA